MAAVGVRIARLQHDVVAKIVSLAEFVLMLPISGSSQVRVRVQRTARLSSIKQCVGQSCRPMPLPSAQ